MLPEAQALPEAVVIRFHRHGRRLGLPVIMLLALAAASGYAVGSFPEAWMNLLAGICAGALALLVGVIPILVWLARRVTVTTRRIIMRHGVLVHHRAEVSLGRVREVRLRRGPVQRLLGAGDIELFVGADAPTRLVDVPGAVAVVDALHELVERNYLRGAPTH